MLKIPQFSGINNQLPAERMGKAELAVATDVDVGNSQELRRRDGFSALTQDCHKNLFESGNYTLATRMGGELVAWPSSGSHADAVTLHEALGIARAWYCQLPDGRTTFSNGLINGITDGSSATGWGVPVPQDFGGVSPVAGKLPAGEYRYALTYSRLSDKQEGGALYSAPVALDEGGILLMGLPELDGYELNVYLTPPNSDHAYFAGVARGGVFSYLGAVDALTLPCRTAFLSPAPVGTLTAFWRGRVLVAVGKVLYASLHGQWELFDLQRDYKQFGADITLVQAVDDGVYVGTAHELVFLAGTDFDGLQFMRVLTGRVVLGSGVMVRGDLVGLGKTRGSGTAMLCIADAGVVAGFNSGQVHRLTHETYRTQLDQVAAMFREVAGIPQYVAVPV